MNGARDQFLAGAAFTRDQNSGLAGGHLAGHGKHFLHGRRAADQAIEHSLIAQLPVKKVCFLGEPPLRSGPLDQHLEGAGLDGLFQEPESSQVVDGLDGVLNTAECRQNNRRRGVALDS